MINELYRLIKVVIIGVVICAILSGCTVNDTRELQIGSKNYSGITVNTNMPESGIVAKNDLFALEWDMDKKNVQFHDLKTGRVFSNSPGGASDEVRYDEDGMIIKNNPQIESGISVSYYDSVTLEEKTIFSYVATSQNETVTAELIDNGIRVIYDFVEEKMMIPVDYTIREDCFNISVDPTEICDDGINYVTGISIAPFLCGVENDSKESYLFIPDGSGAIIEPVTLGNMGKTGSIAVYGGDRAISQFAYKTYTEQCYMPIFGMKSEKDCILAIIDSSAERAYINWNVGSSNIRYSTVYPYFRIMGYNLIEQPPGFVSSSAECKVFNETINPERLSVSYYTIYGEDCGYNDMADTYRNYLNRNCGLSEINEKNINLSLEIEGGMEEKKFLFGIPYTGFISLTTVKQAMDITEYFSNLTDDLLVRLCGFTESGLDVGMVAGGLTVNKKLGSKKDISSLTDYCRNNDIALSLEFDPISFNKSGKGYSIKKSSAYFSDYSVNYLQMYNEVTRNSNGIKYFLLSRELIPQVLSQISRSADSYDFETVGIGTFGKTIYSDFRNEETSNCNEIQEDVIDGIRKLSESKKVAVTGANDYAACVCDYISGAPTTSSGFDVVSYDIPFYSIVFKGYISMNSKAINLAADERKALLKCIESGIAPTYTLICNFSRDVVTSEYSVTRSSDYMSMRENIKATVLETKSLYEAVSNAKIIEHTKVDENVRRIDYDNGVTIYVNYGPLDASDGEIAVPAEGYTVIGGKMQ